MARSHATYVVLLDGLPLAGFTVRHELVTWLDRQGSVARELEVWRCGDGLSQEKPRPLSVDQLLGASR